MHIAIAGNIGSGKTTLTKMLAKHYGWTPRFEPVDNNPYLDDFYKDMERWSFNLQIYFLNKRFKEVVEISKSQDTIIQDRTIFEDAKIFLKQELKDDVAFGRPNGLTDADLFRSLGYRHEHNVHHANAANEQPEA